MPAPALPDFAERTAEGLYTIDTGFHGPLFDAAYLLVDGDEAAFVDSGTNHSVPRLLETLEATGLPREAVTAVIPTHVHLDHAGGVGALMQALPRARLWVHPRGARHMVDPSALYQGALAVYGQAEMDRSYGTLLPVPADRVVPSDDTRRWRVGRRTLEALDAPGHARHHHVLWDEQSEGWFTGDTFGLSYRSFALPDGRRWALPTSTPVQFEPDALLRSMQTMLERRPRTMYLTHYGAITQPAAIGALLRTQVEAMVAVAQRVQARSLAPADRHAALKEGLTALYRQSLADFGHPLAERDVAGELALDIELNAQGLAVWLDRA